MIPGPLTYRGFRETGPRTVPRIFCLRGQTPQTFKGISRIQTGFLVKHYVRKKISFPGRATAPLPPRYVRPSRWRAQESKQRWQLQASHLCTDWMQFIKAVFWQTNRRILPIYHTEQSLSLIGLRVLENPLSSACLQPNQFLKRLSVNTSHETRIQHFV